MAEDGRPSETLADLSSRRDALRQAAGIPGADPRSLLEAALTELDGAIDVLADSPSGDAAADDAGTDGLPAAARAERRLLQAAFQQAPVPLFLLEQDGTIRRANNKAAELLGSPPGYATGKALTAFVDMPARAAVQTQLAAVARTGKPRQTGSRMLTASGPADVTMAAAAIDLPGDPLLIIVTAAPGPAHAAAPAAAAPEAAASGAAASGAAKGAKAAKAATADRSIQAMTRRVDMVTAVTR